MVVITWLQKIINLQNQNYYQAKKLLFTQHIACAAPCVINIDDQWGKRLARELKEEGKEGRGRQHNGHAGQWKFMTQHQRKFELETGDCKISCTLSNPNS